MRLAQAVELPLSEHGISHPTNSHDEEPFVYVVDHEPSWWFLLQDGEQLYLDVNCEHSFIGYSMLVALNDQETATLRREGRSYVGRLADDINYGAPVLQDSRSPYKARDLSKTHGHLVTEAVLRWRSSIGD